MPVPLTTAALAFAAILLPVSEAATICVGAAGVINQVIATWAAVNVPAPSSEEL